MPRPIHCILLIDDDPDDNYLHKLIIEESGLCDIVRVVENGPMGLSYLNQINLPDYTRPDVILLDINMPGMNGFEFLHHYSQIDAALRSHFVLLMLTTSLNSADTKRAEQLKEINGYLVKPLTKAMLQGVVDTYFNVNNS
ncbi:response regulator [Spirosoma endbachense]|uniref:Response regulator n=1 Tax=Spirosoma endbachense TaxID=2666025 RepID=A0A6P1VUA3_9BACT|nr:response regulator [Spirosoma endbachense]QHV96791.1 response regulator [Spirosoma endbachense]